MNDYDPCDGIDPVPPGTSCDLCTDVGLDNPAVTDRPLGRVWVFLCSAHAYRYDSAQGPKYVRRKA
jgi:hypothetical protein